MSKLFFIGTGKMATAIAGGVVKAGVFAPEELCGYDVNPSAAAAFTAATKVSCSKELFPAFSDSENVLVAVKPQYLREALAPLRGKFGTQTVLSIVAGVSIETLTELTGSSRIVRIMPNTPALVGKGAAAYAGGPGADPSALALAGKILNAVGLAMEVPERLLNAVTGLSGSGPAYVFAFIQALADGGVAEGLPRETALKLAAQTVLGSAAMVLETGLHPAILKDQVTSPAGTTSRGVQVLEEHAFTGTLMQAVRAAAERSAELGKK